MTVLGSATRQFRRLVADESGGSFVDYAIIITLVSIGIGFVMPEIGTFLGDLFGHMTLEINAVATRGQ